MSSLERSLRYLCRLLFLFINVRATPEIYTLSLHDALPISVMFEGHAPALLRCLVPVRAERVEHGQILARPEDRKSTRLNSSHSQISYAVFCLKKKKNIPKILLLDTY